MQSTRRTKKFSQESSSPNHGWVSVKDFYSGQVSFALNSNARLFHNPDQRSIKVIERTAVPVIKVSTKDVRSHVVQLDLSFDAKEHHGLEVLTMIHHILEVCMSGELPLIIYSHVLM